ncbi:MAG: hypothetical protein WCJ58_01025 [bacterium]
MTNRNYNTTLGKPFIRGQEIIIRYGISESERVRLTISEVEAIVDSKGDTNIIQGYSNNLDKIISLSQIDSDTFELIDPITGETIGESMLLKDLFVAIVSYIRKLQKEADSE